MQQMDPDTLLLWQKERRKFVLLDVLPPRTFADAHLPGAINIISDEILERAPAILADRDATIVVYCGSVDCKRAGRAAERLVSLGYSDVWHFVGGKRAWRAAGLAMETGAP